MTYRVGSTFESSKFYVAAHQARAAALKQGDPVCVWQCNDGRHWTLIIDRSMRGDRLPLLQHITNVIKD